MPPKETSVSSAVDQKFFTTLFKFLPSGLDLDWDGLAHELGWKNAKIARTRFGQIRRKYQDDSTGDSPLQGKVTKVMKSPKGKNAKIAGKGRKKDISSEEDEEDEEDMKVTVKKEPEGDATEAVKEEVKSARNMSGEHIYTLSNGTHVTRRQMDLIVAVLMHADRSLLQSVHWDRVATEVGHSGRRISRDTFSRSCDRRGWLRGGVTAPQAPQAPQVPQVTQASQAPPPPAPVAQPGQTGQGLQALATAAVAAVAAPVSSGAASAAPAAPAGSGGSAGGSTAGDAPA
ncbi:hypothetical protein F4811DRAFT_556447 [Daldinia bambusicola]|nr:hypothetical protein F4811DRAFT_556447 [Daldinia bambusicola]